MATPYRHTLLALSITLAAAAAHAQEATLDTVTVVGQETTDYQAKKPPWPASITRRCWTPRRPSR